MTSEPRPVAVNLLGVVEHPVLDGGPWRIDRDGAPYVPLGDGGIVLDLQLGDSVFGLAGDHAEQVDGDRPGLARHRDCPPDVAAGCGWNQLARFAPGSSTTWKASAGPLSSVLGPGPCPNSRHWPVEMTPMVR